MECSQTAADIMSKRVQPVREEAPLMDPVGQLKTNGVAVLVDEQLRPISIMTLCDIDRVLARAQEMKTQGDHRAEDLFPVKSPTYVHTVRVDDSLDRVADQILEKDLDTGIVVVDPRGTYKGYIFAKELKERLSDLVDRRKRDLRSNAESLQRQHPNAIVDIDRWLGSSS